MRIFLVALKILLLIILLALLTFFTQVGGLILLLSFLSHKFINNRTESVFWRGFWKTSAFLVLYFFVNIALLPFAARAFNRVPMPVFSEPHVKPLRLPGCIFNRHYVRPEVRAAVIETAERMQKESPGVVIQYLDGAFPLINHFPLWPHRSHGDGKKLDIAFHYLDVKTKKPVVDAPSFLGYGISEKPRPGESDFPLICGTDGHWQYNILDEIIPQGNHKNFIFDSTRTALLVNKFAASKTIDRILIEPHLKTRLGITSKKIRFHGCRAIRHDDHIHVQMK
ncbi:hypothetical protein [Pseudobacter ginsenosidimutans]|uniref:Uncharacterized protein n=1 Tax=Pseudobacter ginsenosidimutans TaxID=661488 RepID=A0A4Q7MDR4_9BACT|nr:hypothetical protein [Pseudobacter ginsenosidimutans]QEC45245.1 hypothetical protein FSB84_27450 [Pseudobacter ginsenosidimutans]RZS65513.1 hypothetical protein EV199_5687 [Pseudobacter ginsenosidimutans]